MAVTVTAISYRTETLAAPFPLVGEGWGGESTLGLPMRRPPSLPLPHKGGGNVNIKIASMSAGIATRFARC